MKVIINDITYNPENDLIIIQLTDEDKKLIANMAEDAHFIAYFNNEKLYLDDVKEKLKGLKCNGE